MKDITFLTEYNQKFEKGMIDLDNYIDKILPLKNFGMLCQVLHEILISEKEFNRLIEYERLLFPKFVERIEDKN